MTRPTISSIAKTLGVSKMTISRVINNQPGVSAELREQINRIIEEVGYTPSLTARSLAKGKSGIIGVFVPAIVSEWITPLLLGINEEAFASGFQMLVRSTGHGKSLPRNAPELITGNDLIDGLIIISWRVPVNFALEMVSKNVPVIIVDGFIRSPKVSWVSCADREGMINAVEHLVNLGHQKIAFIGGGTQAYLARERLSGFTEGMARMKTAIGDNSIIHSDFTLETGRDCAYKLLNSPDRPTAIIAVNDPVAIGVIQVAHELGIEIPGELSVIGIDDTLAQTSVPPLTSVLRDYQGMGKAAMRLLSDQISGRVLLGTVTQMDLGTSLTIRKTTAQAFSKPA